MKRLLFSDESLQPVLLSPPHTLFPSSSTNEVPVSVDLGFPVLEGGNPLSKPAELISGGGGVSS